MYKEKMMPILTDIENKDNDIAGGSVVGIVLSTINSLIKYIANLTIDKKNYENVQEEVKSILKEADLLKNKTLEVIDKDKEVLGEILKTYKLRKENEELYEISCKKGVEFCIEVLEMAYKTLILSNRISKVGNKMLCSDFEICKYYSFASIKSAIVNVDINLKAIKDENYKRRINDKCNEILDKSRSHI